MSQKSKEIDSDIASILSEIEASLPSMEWQLVVLDDDHTPMDFVVKLFLMVAKITVVSAVAKMLEVHHKGSTILMYGSEEECRKAEAIVLKANMGCRVEKAT